MAEKRKEIPSETSGRDKKKQKTAIARTIAVQPPASLSANAVAGPSKTVQFENAQQLPGSLDVERFAEARAFEINAMHAAMETARADNTHRAWQQLPRHLRRRAASHDVRRVPLRLRDKAKAEMDVPKAKPKKHIPQRGKARREPRTKMLQRRQVNKSWLESHIWHAKRMHMENMWGYRLAVTPTEKSFRPSHRASMHGSILHDASYYGLIELKGPEHVLRLVFDRCTDCQAPSVCAKRFITGARACVTHMYKRDSYPLDLIGPAKILWRPLPGDPTYTSADQQNITSASQGKQRRQNKGKQKAKEAEQPSDDVQRTAWIWVHPSIYEQVYSELHICVALALEHVKESDPSIAEPLNVELADLRKDLNVFEIMGPKASQVIRGALKPVFDNWRADFSKFWDALASLQSAGSVPRNAVIGFKVHDPRLSFPPKNSTVTIDKSKLPSVSSSVTSLYPTSSLARSEIWEESVRQPLEKPKYKKKDIDQRRSKLLVPGTNLQAQREDDRIPVLMIQRSIENSSSQLTNSPFSNSPAVHGWTLIIPAGWSMAFFPSLIHTGTRVGGQRECQTQAFESSTPSFPSDYPSTSAYNDFAEQKGKEKEERWKKKPPAKRPGWGKLGVRSPWKPDWDVVLGLKEPQQVIEEPMLVGDDFIEADRIHQDDPAEPLGVEQFLPDALTDVSVEMWTELTPPPEETCRPWLLRGAGVAELVTSLAGPNMTEASRLDALTQYVEAPRVKRDIPSLAAKAAGTDGPPRMTPAEMYRCALVRVCLRLLGRGCPSDMALIYEVKDEEILESGIHQDNLPIDIDETEQRTVIPPQDSIIGYVTTGSFSLSLGESSAIGAIPLAKLVELYSQARRLHRSFATVNVRDGHEVICRPAKVLVMED